MAGLKLTPTDWIWRDGQFIRWADATVHVLTHSLQYGSSVFEGIRCYETPNGPAIFRLHDHLARFHVAPFARRRREHLPGNLWPQHHRRDRLHSSHRAKLDWHVPLLRLRDGHRDRRGRACSSLRVLATARRQRERRHGKHGEGFRP